MRSAWLLMICGWLLAACGGATPAPVEDPTLEALTSALPEFKILSPKNEAVVNVPEVEVIGQAAPETVITLNDEVVVVDESRTFSVILPLEEGPNELEVVASNPQGQEVSFILEVTYDPES